MPLGFHRCHPAGMPENSPAFQRRGKFRIAQVPKGRLNGWHVIRQLQPSLRDLLMNLRDGLQPTGSTGYVPGAPASLPARGSWAFAGRDAGAPGVAYADDCSVTVDPSAPGVETPGYFHDVPPGQKHGLRPAPADQILVALDRQSARSVVLVLRPSSSSSIRLSVFSRTKDDLFLSGGRYGQNGNDGFVSHLGDGAAVENVGEITMSMRTPVSYTHLRAH